MSYGIGYTSPEHRLSESAGSSPLTESAPGSISRVRLALWHEANLRLKFEEVNFADSGQKEKACLIAGSCPATTGRELSDSSHDRRAVDFLKCVPAANQIEPFIHKAINAPNGN